MREAPALLRAWIQRRAREDAELSRLVPDAGYLVLQQAVHPARVVAKAEKVWMPRWGCDTSACSVAAVSRLLTAVPGGLRTCSFFGGLLARALASVDAGLDKWRGSSTLV